MGTASTTIYALGTHITYNLPFGIRVKAAALCPDGVVRSVCNLSATADSFMSVPAAVRIRYRGRRLTISGYITIESVRGFLTPSDDDPLVVKFVPFSGGKNAWPLMLAYTARQGDRNDAVRTTHSARMKQRGVSPGFARVATLRIVEQSAYVREAYRDAIY